MRFWNYKLFFDVGCLIRASNRFKFSTSVPTSYHNNILLFQHHTFYRIYLLNGSKAVCSQFQNVQNSRKQKTLYFYVKMYILVLRLNHWRPLFGDFLRISQFLFRNKTTKCASKDFKKTQKDVYSSTTKYKKSRPFLISNDKLIWRF